jgi:hypothetical protein
VRLVPPVVAVIAAVAAGCGDGEEAGRAEPEGAPRPPAKRAPAPLRRARCPSPGGACRAVSGRIIFVERVDPDGDGDAHFVLVGGSVTAPGITVVDVRRDLRPRPLPGPGDRLSAAGPVFTGSYGQRQIEAVEVHAQRR